MLRQLVEWMARAPEAMAAQEGATAWTVSQLLREADEVARMLRRAGVHAGDRVIWHGGSSLDFAVVLLGTWMLDATYVGINPRYTDREVQEIIARTAPRVVLTPQALATMRAGSEGIIDHSPPLVTDGRYPALLVFTTGSTGRPKIAVISHGAIASASAMQAAQTQWGAVRTINALPANHIGGVVNITTSTWWAAEAVDFIPAFSPQAVIDRLRHTARVRLAAVPMLLRRCLDDPDFADAARGRLVHALSGGAPLPRGVCDELTALGVRVQGMYGMSETSGSLCYTDPGDDAATTCTTVGRPPVGVTLRIAPLGSGGESWGEGEVQARGALVFDGYLDDPAATEAAFTPDGWLRTGDVGVLHHGGALQLTGRLKEIINTGGHKVMPAEIETMLQAHPQVQAAVVVGLPDATFGEAVAAAVVLDPGQAVTWPDLEHWCRTHLANYKVPKRWVQLDRLPILGVGKVDRRAVALHFTEPARV